MSSELISVIICTFNRPRMVIETLKTVISQEDVNIEVIVVDDGSESDLSAELLALNFPIKYIRLKNNVGVQKASIKGYEVSSGQYLNFLGDDDLLCDSRKFAKQIECFRKLQGCGIGVITTRVQKFDDKTGADLEIVPNTWPHDMLGYLLAKNGVVFGSAALIERSAYQLAGGFDPLLPKGTDSDVFRRIAMLKFGIWCLKDVTVKYRVGHSQMSGSDLTAIRKSYLSETMLISKYQHQFSRFRIPKWYREYKLLISESKMYRRHWWFKFFSIRYFRGAFAKIYIELWVSRGGKWLHE